MTERDLYQLIDDAERRLQSLEDTEHAERREAAYRQALLDLVRELEASRAQFHSKRLAELRVRIQALLADPDQGTRP